MNMEVFMKRKVISMMIVLLMNQNALASHEDEDEIGPRDVSYGYARVTRVKPIVRMVEISDPKEECWREDVEYRRNGDVAGATILGGVVGGILGSHLGRGRNRAA